MIDGLQLRSGPNLGRRAVIADDAIKRLHRGMREIRKLEIRRDDLGSLCERSLRVAVLAGHEAGLVEQRLVFGDDVCRAALFRLALVPADFERLAPLDGSPRGLGQHGHALWNLNDSNDAGCFLRSGRVKRGNRRAELQRARDDGDKHVWHLLVDRVFCGAVGFDDRVDTWKCLADVDELVRRFESDLRRNGLLGRRVRHRPKRRRLARLDAHNAVRHRNLASRHAPFLGCRRDDHRPRRRSGPAVLLIGIG